MESMRTAKSIGISHERTGNFSKSRGGMIKKFGGISNTVSHFRITGRISHDWKD